ncbi:hypothetical protein EV363DRAFT_1172356, partial [Boletus edulis]
RKSRPPACAPLSVSLAPQLSMSTRTLTPPIPAPGRRLPLPVTTVVVDGQPRLQKTYHCFAFDVPKPNTSGPFYLVTRGRRVGIFSTSQRTAPHVQGVSLSSHSRVASVDAGLLGMADAIEHKEAELLH